MPAPFARIHLPGRSTPPALVRLAALLFCVVVGLASCGGEDDESAGGGAETTELTTESPCEPVEVPEPREVDVEPPPKKPSAPQLNAVVETSCGTFEIDLATKESPMTAASFEHLARNGVFDDTPFHRIVPGFVIQGGDPTGDGTGGPGYSVDEAPSDDASYTRGVVAMAKTAAEPPGRSGSQFFVVTGADAGLPADYAIAGKVSEGFDVVTAIEQFGEPTPGTETPANAVLIESVTIEER